MVDPAGPMIIGHRGAPGYRPEHTRASYTLALAQGADAVEPDLVASRDGVLVIRHENEISTTTDVASRPEFAGRRATKVIDGRETTGWFTEDFTWAELRTLRAVERLPDVRRASAAFDGMFPLMRFSELLELLQEPGATTVRLVAEIKHPSYFASIGLPLDELVMRELSEHASLGDRLIVECFEKTLLRQLQHRGLRAAYVYLLAAEGAAFDSVAAGSGTPSTYADELTPEGLRELVRPAFAIGRGAPRAIDGISVDKAVILTPREAGHHDVVARAHRLGLQVFCWTFRPENEFLTPRYRTGRGEVFGDWRGELAELAASGVDGIFLDHPDLGRGLVPSG